MRFSGSPEWRTARPGAPLRELLRWPFFTSEAWGFHFCGVASAPELSLGFVNGVQETLKAGNLVDRPQALEAAAERVQVLLSQETYGHDALVGHD